ncbi:MAG: hypothetical protein J2P19_35645 [Pseudonocardia sp.]|nr:hypothetical protein [Pseudonocardia sp.]
MEVPSAEVACLISIDAPKSEAMKSLYLRAERSHDFVAAVLSPFEPGRDSALIEGAATLPPIVIGDLFGLSPNTVQRWARYAKDSWADCFAAARPR